MKMEFYKEFNKETAKEMRKMDKKRRKESKEWKRLDEIADIDLHAEVYFDDYAEDVVIAYFRGSHFLAVSSMSYSDFVEMCTR